MSESLAKVLNRLHRLEDIYVDAMHILNILRGIEEFEAGPTPQEVEFENEPHEHHMLIRAYGKFFDPVRASLSRDLHMQTAKLLLFDRDSLHIHRLMTHALVETKRIKSQLEPFSGDDAPIEDDRTYLATFYQGLTATDVSELKISVDDYEHLILKLDLIRNKRLGHEDLTETPPNMLTLDELENLLGVARKVLNKVSATAGFGGYNEKIKDYEIADRKTSTQFMLTKLYETY